MSGLLFGVSSELKNMKFQKKINFLFSIYDSSFPNPAFRDVKVVICMNIDGECATPALSKVSRKHEWSRP